MILIDLPDVIIHSIFSYLADSPSLIGPCICHVRTAFIHINYCMIAFCRHGSHHLYLPQHTLTFFWPRWCVLFLSIGNMSWMMGNEIFGSLRWMIWSVIIIEPIKINHIFCQTPGWLPAQIDPSNALEQASHHLPVGLVVCVLPLPRISIPCLQSPIISQRKCPVGTSGACPLLQEAHVSIHAEEVIDRIWTHCYQ